MKKFLLSAIISFTTVIALAQNNVGIGTATPNTSAILDISSNNKGLLTPRMTTAQRNNISTPAKGLLVYDTDLNALYHYNGNAWAAVGGSGGSFNLPYSGSTNQAGDAFSITNTGAGTAISGTVSANSIAAIEGSSTATVGGYGVLGNSTSATGFGVGGINATGTAVYGFSSGSGTALRGVSASGYGLLSSGNLRLTGGNTNPSAGAVLTSLDANGNAVWKNNKVGFCVRMAANTSIPVNTIRKVEFSQENYDLQNNFTPYAGSATANSSTFIAPVAGVYHFTSQVILSLSSLTTNFRDGDIMLFINGNIFARAIGTTINSAQSSNMPLTMTTSVHLNAGDQVWIAVSQYNASDISAELYSLAYWGTFTGNLLFAD